MGSYGRPLPTTPPRLAGPAVVVAAGAGVIFVVSLRELIVVGAWLVLFTAGVIWFLDYVVRGKK